MNYPRNLEQKIGFDEIRTLLKAQCLSTLGKEIVDEMKFSNQLEQIQKSLEQVREFRQILSLEDDFPIQYFYDMRKAIMRIRPMGTHLDENEIFDLRRSLSTIQGIIRYLDDAEEGDLNEDKRYTFPALHELTIDVMAFPEIIRQIDTIIDKFGNIKDSASPELMKIRSELSKTEGSISRILSGILKSAQKDGLVDSDVSPTIRDGRLVIPVAPAVKRKIKGIVHDESATGKTLFVEPTEVVEANNRIRELESDERREILRILTDFTCIIRPHVQEILYSYRFLAIIDFIKAKSELANRFKAIEPSIQKSPHIDWINAVHPLLQLSLEKQQKKAVPLDIMLTAEKRILIISGPNAGGKSVCLKTVGLLQYMLQCGLSIPVGDHSKTGVFDAIMIDIGDEQSIENDLSTYSSHLLNMKNMMKYTNERTLLLIDEFGSGTEPLIGGAIAESVLKRFCKEHSFGIITTHYQNLKHFAENNEGVVNGAMLYDRKEMKALFKLQIGQPGSSFAIEIARKIGIPDDVIKNATEIVGKDYIMSDKYLQDIIRDKRYWENKRQTIHSKEKEMESVISKYENELQKIETERKNILSTAKEQAETLLKDSNKRIENVIKEIKEKQAAKEETKKIRQELDSYKQEVSEADAKLKDELISKKMAQLIRRKERKEKKKKEKKLINDSSSQKNNIQNKPAVAEITAGDYVRIKGLQSVGKVQSIEGQIATLVVGDMKTKLPVARLEHAETPKQAEIKNYAVSRETREAIDNHKLEFKTDIDVRGMRGEEAINAITYFIDDAILVGVSPVRILHGKGNGILRQLIRQYLATVPNVSSFRDENVQFGGSGITVVNLK